jgi:hypothetical protein
MLCLPESKLFVKKETKKSVQGTDASYLRKYSLPVSVGFELLLLYSHTIVR